MFYKYRREWQYLMHRLRKNIGNEGLPKKRRLKPLRLNLLPMSLAFYRLLFPRMPEKILNSSTMAAMTSRRCTKAPAM
ncbi:hypothetical protein BCO26_2207 [Heyndrickxia coagulans 2-6]|nr:hypothetical protein BCO26_2207 [Heyndrickxia coagulans 2-6]